MSIYTDLTMVKFYILRNYNTSAAPRWLKMSLEDKSNENLKLTEHILSKRNDLNNAVAGRFYYSVFQKIKFILLRDGFDYSGYIISLKKEEKCFSHGTIRGAVIAHITKNKKITINLNDLAAINNIDFLYKKRIAADYKDESVSDKDVAKCMQYCGEIIDFLKKI